MTKFTKHHRKYPESSWDYRAISTIFENKEIYYYTLNDKGEKSTGVEIYQGPNYLVDAHTIVGSRSYSRRYDSSDGVSAKYSKIVSQLKKIHKQTKWSREKRVDLN